MIPFHSTTTMSPTLLSSRTKSKSITTSVFVISSRRTLWTTLCANWFDTLISWLFARDGIWSTPIFSVNFTSLTMRQMISFVFYQLVNWLFILQLLELWQGETDCCDWCFLLQQRVLLQCWINNQLLNFQNSEIIVKLWVKMNICQWIQIWSVTKSKYYWETSTSMWHMS